MAGSSTILALDTATLTYRPSTRPSIPSLSATRGIQDPEERIRTLFRATDKAGAYLRETLPPLLMYAARVAPDIAYSIDDVDRAMRWGFGWELGPFELFDAIGVEAVVRAWREASTADTRAAAGCSNPRGRDGPVPHGRRAGPVA
jgi:3-hydroxyacyl-CoA dehydrogenase